jgi:hypothetical protein
MYQFWLFVHVLAATIWVGGAITLNFLATRMMGTSAGPVEMAGFMRRIEWIGLRVFTPASVILLIAGTVMTIDAWSFETLWIAIGIAGLLYSVVNGAFIVGPLARAPARSWTNGGRKIMRCPPTSGVCSFSAASSSSSSSLSSGR